MHTVGEIGPEILSTMSAAARHLHVAAEAIRKSGVSLSSAADSFRKALRSFNTVSPVSIPCELQRWRDGGGVSIVTYRVDKNGDTVPIEFAIDCREKTTYLSVSRTVAVLSGARDPIRNDKKFDMACEMEPEDLRSLSVFLMQAYAKHANGEEGKGDNG